MSSEARRIVCRFGSTVVALAALATSMIPRSAAQEERTPDEWAALRQASQENLKEIGIAMQNYHDVNKSFPAAYRSKNGKPLLSWRVSLLPYLGASSHQLYGEFHFDEPWDSQHNSALIARMPDVFRSPASKLDGGRTVYLAPRGASTMFPGKDPVKIRQIRDGTSKTIAIIEVDDAQAVPWTKPDDWEVDPDHPKLGFHGPFPDGVNTAACDVSRHFIPLDVEENVLKALLTIDGREPVAFPR